MTDIEYLRLACQFAAETSDDLRTQNGAVLAMKDGEPIDYLIGANRLPSHIHGGGRLFAPAKYLFIEHAEREVIYTAARLGVQTDGATLYCPWFACCDCARAIIGAGIKEVVGLAILDVLTPERWRANVQTALQMLIEARIGTRWVADRVGAKILFDDKEIEV